MLAKIGTVFFLCLILSGCMSSISLQDIEHQRAIVMEREKAFAQTMAKRDHQAFTLFLAEDVIFFSNCRPTRGKQAVAALWKPLFESSTPPFSWEPQVVEVLQSGHLALSTGPVYSAEGSVLGHFTSIWRRNLTGEWYIVFDKGDEACE